MSMLYFATLFDSNYLNKGLALYYSMQRFIPNFRLFILCLDDNVYDYFIKSPHKNVHPIRLSDLERDDADLLTAKSNRSKVEYYFTLSPVLPLYILKKFQEVDFITTLDADIFFFSDPEPIYEEFKGKSILITPHRFPAKSKEKEIYGLYNVSFQIFRKDSNGLECLNWWRLKCIEWCYDNVDLDNSRFADQKYLDNWESMFKGVVVLQNEGAGLAPWNIDNYRISYKGGKVYSNDQLIIFYHFHYLKMVKNRWFIHGVDLYSNKMTNTLKNYVYHPYISLLIKIKSKLKVEVSQHQLRLNSAPTNLKKKDILKNYSTLYNLSSRYTIQIELKEYLNQYRRIKENLKSK